MYLLKKEHKEIRISSNYLWEKAIRDIEANKPWQKLKKNLLLLLQLLFLISSVLFLTQPFIMSDSIGNDNLILVLDRSASMQSTDQGKSRFDTAKREIEKIIENTKPNTKITLVTMDSLPRIIVNDSKDKAFLKSKLQSIEASDNSDNLEDTLSLLKAMVKEIENYSIIFYTDKGIDSTMDNLTVKKIKGDGINLAMEDISYSLEEDGLNVLTTIRNYSEEEAKVDIILYTDNEIMDVKEITLEANGRKNLYWSNISPKINIIRAEIDIIDDSLEVDNTRWAVVNSNPISKVLLITKGNLFLEKAISISKNIDLYKTNEALENANGYDLYIYDGILPQKLPVDGNLVIFNPPSNDFVKVIGKRNSGELKLLNDQLFKYVNLDFNIKEVKTLKTPNWAMPILLLDDQPIIVKGQREKQKFVVMGFDIHDTDLPLKIDFPILIQNILDYTLNLNKQEDVSILSGDSLELYTSPKVEEIFIVSPDDKRIKIGPPFPLASYNNTHKVGVYIVEQKYDNQTFENYFVSNIDTEKESNSNYDISDSKGNFNNESQVRTKTGRNIGNILLLIALGFLAIEWVVYNRGY